MKKKLLVAAVLGTAVGVGIYLGKKYLGKLSEEIEKMGELEDGEDWDEDLCEDDFEDDDEVVPVEPATPEKEVEVAPVVEDKVEDVIPTPANVEKPERPWAETNPVAGTTPTV